jgi:circadian clock protein KaiC
MDMLKMNQISSLFTSLSQENSIIGSDMAEDAVSSLVDTWIKVRNEESNNILKRSLYIEKSRGMGHTSEIEILLSRKKALRS